LMRSDLPYRLRVGVVPLLAVLSQDDPSVMPLLVDGLTDEDNDVRTECARNLVLIGRSSQHCRPKVTALLVETLNDRHFATPDKYVLRPASDYAYDALVSLMSSEQATGHDPRWHEAIAAHRARTGTPLSTP
jgi:hypothetical protein